MLVKRLAAYTHLSSSISNAAFTPAQLSAQLVAGNKHHVARNKLLVARNKLRVARNMLLQATSCAQLVARNLLRWCKRGIRYSDISVASDWLSRVSTLTRDIDIAILSVRLSVSPSVRNKLVLYENGLTYRHRFFTVR